MAPPNPNMVFLQAARFRLLPPLKRVGFRRKDFSMKMATQIEEWHDKAARYDDLIAAVRELDARNKALLALSVDADENAQEQAGNAFEIALHEVLEFAWEDDHADAMQQAGVICNELHRAQVTRTA